MPGITNDPFHELAREATLQAKEQFQHKKQSNKGLSIGIPKEITYQENRIPISPLSVELLINNGHEIKIESQAGKGANFRDVEYSEVGAKIVLDKQEIFNCDILLKVDPPTEDEIEMMKPGQLLISALQIATLKDSYIRLLMRKKINAIGYEFLRDDSGSLPVIRARSEIAGRASVLIAAEYLNNVHTGKGELIGGIPGIQPTKIVIIGAGAVGEYAARAAIGLGAQVKIFDNSLFKLRRLENNLGHRIFSSTLLPNVLAKSLSTCDVAIGALRSKAGQNPCVVTEEMVKNMRSKALIIDVSIDQGGCFETSRVTNHKEPVFELHEVIHYCVPNIASRVARTASYALSNIFTPLLLEMGEEGGFSEYLWSKKGIRKGVYIYKGNLTNNQLASRFNMNAKEIDFLIAGNL
jgi:alanine dehydrogenase